jgi:hypothetical protein
VRVDLCAHCGSASAVRHVKVDQSVDAGGIGLSYRTRFRIVGMEPLFADLCDECGSIARICIDTPARKWVTK